MHVRRAPVVGDRSAAGVRPLVLRPLGGGPVLPTPIFALVGSGRDAGPGCETYHPVAATGRNGPECERHPGLSWQRNGGQPRSPEAVSSASRTSVRTAEPVPPLGV